MKEQMVEKAQKYDFILDLLSLMANIVITIRVLILMISSRFHMSKKCARMLAPWAWARISCMISKTIPVKQYNRIKEQAVRFR